MAKSPAVKEKWTLSFDSRLKKAVIREAKNIGVYPVHYLRIKDVIYESRFCTR